LPHFKPVNRRQFMAYSAAIAATSTLPMGSFAQGSMRTRAIPGTNEHLPVIGMGAPDIFIDLPPEGKALPKAVLQSMVDMGGTLLDTPSFFRPNPPILGEILTEMGLQDKMFLTGKITVGSKEQGDAHLEKMVAKLDKHPMDLLMIHNMRNMGEHWSTLKEWKESGRTRYIGVSLTRQKSYAELEKFMKAEKPDFILTGYSVFHQQAAESALPLAADLGIGVIGAEAFKSGEDGNFFGMTAGKQLPEWTSEFDCESWAQFALKYVISNPAMTAIVTETSKVKHVVDNMGAGYGRLPDEKTRKKMSNFIESL
jgi:diketogulonate reductase-like aldo/keto reductase